MELESATLHDIMQELQRRQLRFVFIGVEITNSGRKDATCFAAQAASKDELLSLIKASENACSEIDDGEYE